MGRKVSCSFPVLFGLLVLALCGVSPARAVPPAETLLARYNQGLRLRAQHDGIARESGTRPSWGIW